MVRPFAIVVLLLALLAPVARAQDVADQESVIRAAFLFRLAFLVSWPDSAFAATDNALRLCIVDSRKSNLARDLAKYTATRKVNGRAVEVVVVAGEPATKTCHLLYVAGPTPAAQEWLRRAAADPAVLVVVDSLRQMDAMGTLALVREVEGSGEAKLLFYLNRDRARNSALRLEPKLLQLVRFHPAG